MAEWLRRAGRGRLADGTSVVWTVAEGRRGRRWREVRTTGDGSVLSSLLLETDPGGRFSHLELATAAGLLTLHPEDDGTLHGNVVGPDGIRHVRGLPWPDGSGLVVDGSAISVAAALLDPRSAKTGVLVIDLQLEIRPGAFAEDRVPLDRDGLPVLGAAETWPLEE